MLKEWLVFSVITPSPPLTTQPTAIGHLILSTDQSTNDSPHSQVRGNLSVLVLVLSAAFDAT